jgi:hypothetical protein
MIHMLPGDYSMEKFRFLEKTGKIFGHVLSPTSLFPGFALLSTLRSGL